MGLGINIGSIVFDFHIKSRETFLHSKVNVWLYIIFQKYFLKTCDILDLKSVYIGERTFTQEASVENEPDRKQIFRTNFFTAFEIETNHKEEQIYENANGITYIHSQQAGMD